MRPTSQIYTVLALATISARVVAQSPPPVRPLGPVLATSTAPLASVTEVRALPGGRVLVSDYAARRVLLFDSTFQHVSVVMDTAATQFPYALIRYRGDSTLCVDTKALAMLVIDANGSIVRSIAIPDPRRVYAFLGGPYGTPGLDARGRLVYGLLPSRPTTERANLVLSDSAPIERFDLASRARDSVTAFAVPPARYGVRTSTSGGRTRSSSWLAVDPIPWTDDWTVLSDGTIAVVRGREYRVDFIDADNKVTPGPKLPFEWQRLADSGKAAIIDSVRSARERRLVASIAAQQAALPAATKPGPPPPTPEEQAAAVQTPFVTIDEMPDYRPVFGQGDVHSDLDGRVWIRTSKSMNGGAVYDVIDNKGALVDRIAVPPGRVIAGFGSGGVVYMGVLDGNIARLERARVH